jgi:ribonucleoside-diphosphate reductase alpha chain
MELKRHFTVSGQSPYSSLQWTTHQIMDRAVEAPAAWSLNAVEIAATKYLRQRGLGVSKKEGETSVKQLFERVVKAIRRSGELQGYFRNKEQAEIFEAELNHILLNQMASFNSPVYFNVGLYSAYGIQGDAENFVFDENLGHAIQVKTAYVSPQASACFIQDVQDDLISIFDLLKNEAKLFKYGSGTGTNFSRLRAKGEALQGGGESTGLISYLEIFDKAAGAIKSGGTTRRAAKMVVLDADHPEILDFINWKMLEERKARVLLANGYAGGMEGEAFRTVSGQNSNNSVRVTDQFLEAAQTGGTYSLKSRTNQHTVKEVSAAEILRAMARAAWECADPGIQFEDTIQKWHTCSNTGPIRSSNPCSEYMFLDDSACNLASLNLVKFLKAGASDLNWEDFRQCVRVMLLAQDILVDYASYPTAKIAENSHQFRPLGLGYANLGGLLLRMAIPYDSEEAAKWTANITAAMHALSLQASCELALQQGPFAGWMRNEDEAIAVLKLHRDKAKEIGVEDWIQELFSKIVKSAEQNGLRNAQVTLLAPTGTIGLLMDCDTLGIEPDFSLIKRKTLAGGGEMRIVNQSVEEALRRLNYAPEIITRIEKFISERGTINGASDFKAEHAPIFDCATAPQDYPERRITPEGHLRIMAAAQPFLSGAISKTVNLPSTTSVEEIEQMFLRAWKLGLKALAVYRDGSKALQPLCAEC